MSINNNVEGLWSEKKNPRTLTSANYLDTYLRGDYSVPHPNAQMASAAPRIFFPQLHA
jgi:hypothetical protein